MPERRFIVLGLGTFGKAMAVRLSQNGCRVTGVDADATQVEMLQEHLYEALVGDVTNRASLEQLMLHHAEAVIISLGEDIERSILASLHAKELGARDIYAKGVTPEHGKILKKLGVTRVIYPEAEIAQQMADEMTYPNVLKITQMDPEYSMAEIVAPPSVVGKRLAEVELPRRFNLILMGVKEALAPRWEMTPKADHVFTDEQLLLVWGNKKDINKFSQSG
jgi:trk system potassium uptake protein TrkA